jgi:hypothetical protein
LRETIRHAGDSAKELFRQLVTNVRRSNDLSAGDTEVFLDNEWHHIDVKECRSNTINQVRAIRYETLVIHSHNVWFVIPPQEVVRLVSQKSRGQHSEIPYECANLSLNNIDTVYRCSDSQLAERVYSAVRMGQEKQFIKLIKRLKALQDDLKIIKEQTKKDIETIYDQLLKE